ncbi:MAG TPA: hypothetical protein VG899_05585 [Mycobacteriales bacterium]|nr:hypothetical protein [Mycobacteriales bacterium]
MRVSIVSVVSGVSVVSVVAVAGTWLAGTPAGASAGVAQPPVFQVGAAVVGLNPKVTVYSGGFGVSPPIKPGSVIGPRLSARAMYISNGTTAVEFALVDAQAEFAAYQEGPEYGITAARTQAAKQIDAAGHGPSISAADIIVSATHSHSAPTLEGLWGPVPTAYLKAVTAAETKALVEAAAAARPAYLRFGTANASSLDLVAASQYDAFAGWADDPLLTVLQAVSPQTGATIATYATVPAHPDIVNGERIRHLTTDYPGLVHAALQRQLGGVAIVGPATLGREETPVQATDIPEDHVFAANVLDLVDSALARAQPVMSNRLAASQRMIQIPGTGALLLALVSANNLPDAQKRQIENVLGQYPVDRADVPPYQTGLDVGTWVTALRVGDLAYVSMPGEPFPEIRHALQRAAPGATVIALSKGQDDLGYFYPAYVTPFTEIYPSDTFTNSASALTGDLVVAGQEANLSAVGFATTPQVLDPVSTQPLQALDPGLQVVGGPFVTDAGPDGKARVRMIATYSPPDLPEATTADGLPVGSIDIKENPTGKVHWSFGAVTGYHDFSGSDLKPYIVTHAFGVGVHHVTARILDAAGQPVTTSFTVHVYAPLRVSLTGGRVVVRGGDGHVLATRWSEDRRTVTVTDGTGTMARAMRIG